MSYLPPQPPLPPSSPLLYEPLSGTLGGPASGTGPGYSAPVHTADEAALPGSAGSLDAAHPLVLLDRATALFLDFDGTLVEIAARPEQVVVPPGLPELLARLSERLGGALAIVSGRQLRDLDLFLAPLCLPAAGEHGAEQRGPDGRVRQLPAPDLRLVTQAFVELAEAHAGLQVEIKAAAVALHYRQAPELEDLCQAAAAEAVARSPGLELLRGKCVFEAKPLGVSKGLAIDRFMTRPPFNGRRPVFVGDDTTDEAGFAVVQSMRGQGIKVGPGCSVAAMRCNGPPAVLAWLRASLQALEADPEAVAGSRMAFAQQGLGAMAPHDEGDAL